MLIDNEFAQIGANEQPIFEGDAIEWHYLNYAEAFPEAVG
jgi:hypothetical protein